jgi:hypothetical protein
LLHVNTQEDSVGYYTLTRQTPSKLCELHGV